MAETPRCAVGRPRRQSLVFFLDVTIPAHYQEAHASNDDMLSAARREKSVYVTQDEAGQRFIETLPVPLVITSMGLCVLKPTIYCASAIAATREPPPLFGIVSQCSMQGGLRIVCIAASGRIEILRRTSFRHRPPPPLLVTQGQVSSAEPSGVSTRCLAAR